jgi:hypothetical protein
MRQRAAALALAATVVPALLVGGCSIDPTGVEGTVTDRFSRHDPATHASDFYLAISGQAYRVDYATYAACFRGSHYPACKHL